MSGIEERSERKQCRSGNRPDFIIAGQMVKSHLTVIKFDGALPKEYLKL
jgi:hypothetical protein